MSRKRGISSKKGFPFSNGRSLDTLNRLKYNVTVYFMMPEAKLLPGILLKQ